MNMSLQNLKNKFFLFACGLTILCNLSALSEDKVQNDGEWKLVWQDNFNKKTFNSKYWTKIERGKPDWKKHMSSDPSLYEVQKGNLILHGKVNPDTQKDPVPYITGGLSTENKFAFAYGKIEIRAKLEQAQGAWPALWLLPNGGYQWPNDGEIDLMEHLNYDKVVYQTIHTHYTSTLNIKNPPNHKTSPIDQNDYNIYGLEWYPDKLIFFVNGKESFTYPKLKDKENEKQWPFTKPFFILIDMQLGGQWVGKVSPDQLPVKMYIDWIKVYKNKHTQIVYPQKNKSRKK